MLIVSPAEFYALASRSQACLSGILISDFGLALADTCFRCLVYIFRFYHVILMDATRKLALVLAISFFHFLVLRHHILVLTLVLIGFTQCVL